MAMQDGGPSAQPKGQDGAWSGCGGGGREAVLAQTGGGTYVHMLTRGEQTSRA